MKRWCINIPKNLIRVAIVGVLCSFAYITYLLTNKQLLDEFVFNSNKEKHRDYEQQTFVHPFF
jgi:hypothetical protein